MKKIFILAAMVMLVFALPAVASPPGAVPTVQVLDQAVSLDLGVYTVESAPIQEAPAPDILAFDLYVSPGNAPMLAGLMYGVVSTSVRETRIAKDYYVSAKDKHVDDGSRRWV